MFKQLSILLVGLLAVGLVVGCGDSGSAEEPLTKAEFIERATTICRENRKKNVEAAKKLFAEESGQSYQEVAAEGVRNLLIPNIRAQTEEVRALGTPPGDEAKIDAIFDEIERVLVEAGEAPLRYLQEVTEYKRPFKEAHRMAKAYGIQACGWA